MKVEEVLQRLAPHRDALVALGVKSLAVFGSVARNEANDASDVDLLVEFIEPVGLFRFAHVRRFLCGVLGCEVDLVTRAGLREEMRETILKEAIRAA